MSWLVFSYSLPSKGSSSRRVTLWRRLRRIGALALSGVQILPQRDDCLEGFQWLAQEVQQAQGEALIMQVELFQGMSDQTIIKKFRDIRAEDYQALELKITDLEKTFLALNKTDDFTAIREGLEKLYKHYAEIRQIDFFDCPEHEKVASHLRQLSMALLPSDSVVTIALKSINDYQDVNWFTRSQPHVDRLACIWLIRRFINPKAIIRYGKTPHQDEISFDVHEGDFQHQGNLCTFEVMVKSFDLEDRGLRIIAEIVHAIDLRDDLYFHPQITGIDTLLRGWLLAGFSDTELETHGIALFEGLYTACLKDSSLT